MIEIEINPFFCISLFTNLFTNFNSLFKKLLVIIQKFSRIIQ
jgi:hypothetical protein